ncbi:MAG: ferric reductase-like transmembrane domain-containing protein [Anaerolineae bacterium]|jgi:sulfoxide reductase heme-binding subunit YedZ|nr:sulfoxide reductase heme-binding subunit YedZ [Chloroflexota bacterium]
MAGTRQGPRTVMLLGSMPALLLALAALLRVLGPDPVGTVLRRTGDAALVLLLLSLAPGAMVAMGGDSRSLRYRRPLGLLAAGYALGHLLLWLGLFQGWNLQLVRLSLAQGRYAWLGLAALAILTVLAATSNRGAQRRLGRNWARLHRLAYVAAALAVWHYAWVFKELGTLPLLAIATLALLLGVRLLALLRRRRGRGGR